MPVGQDQQAAVVGDEVQAAILVAAIPANPAIPHGAFPGRRRKAQQGHPLAEVGRHAPQGFAEQSLCRLEVADLNKFILTNKRG